MRGNPNDETIFEENHEKYSDLRGTGIVCISRICDSDTYYKACRSMFFDIWHDKLELEYYMEYAMSLAIGVEFVKMLCTHQPGTIIEVLLFATARQMIVEHLNVYETLVGIGAIAALFAIRKFLFCSFDEADHMICRGSQTVAHANLITGAKIPEEKTRILRSVISDKLSEEGKTVAIGACVYYKDCALRVDSMREGVVTRVEVIKNL